MVGKARAFIFLSMQDISITVSVGMTEYPKLALSRSCASLLNFGAHIISETGEGRHVKFRIVIDVGEYQRMHDRLPPIGGVQGHVSE